ncbi:MAG: hypothetical protein GXN93_04960, partial [Candidatus Diapherotrites archaeon]|nr:hypothetical protein [Candidatus Diapherotrites archaeon]
MADIREALEGIYRKAEDAFYSMLDWLDERGIPVYNVHDWLEDHGIPPFPAFAATLLLLIGGLAFFLLSSPTYTVMVTVTDGQTGLGVANASVELLSGGTIIATTTTNSAGTAIFSGVKGGTYTVKVLADKYSPATSTLTVSSNMSTASIQLEPLTPHNEFCLQVLDNSGNTVTNAQVTIGGQVAQYDPNNDEYCAKVSSDTVSITVMADGFSTYTNTVSAKQGTKSNPFVVTLTPETASAAGATYSVGVKVLGPDGKPLTYTPVYIYSADGKKLITQTVTDNNGMASFDSVPAGQYLLVATDPATHKAVSETIQVDGDKDLNVEMNSSNAYTYEGNNYVPVNVGPTDENEVNAEVQEVNANGNVGKGGTGIFEGPSIPVIFEAYDAKTGKPLEGVQISIISGTFSTSARTNKNGIADVNLPIGEYNISVSDENYITYTITRKISKSGQWITLPMHHDYSPAITLLGLFGPEGEVATLQNGAATTLKFQVAVPYGVKSATLTVGVGERWQERQEILSELSINGDVNTTYNLTGYAESIREIPVTVSVTDNPENIGDNPRIYWIYKVVEKNGETITLKGEVRPTITKDLLKCGYGWAVNFHVVGPMPKPFVLYPDTDYTVRVEYAKCISGGTTPQVALYVDRNQIATGSVSASKRYDYGTTDLPLRFSPAQAGQRKIDVRIVAGEENVLARKYAFYAVVKQVPPAYKYSVGLPHGAKIAYRGLETTVTVGVWAHDRNIASAMINVSYVGRDGNTENVSKSVMFPPYEQWTYDEFNITPYGGQITTTIRFLSAQGKVLYTETNSFKVTDYLTPVTFHFVDALTGEDVNNVTVVLDNNAHSYTLISGNRGVAEGNVALGQYSVSIVPPMQYVSTTMPLKVTPGVSPVTVRLHHDYNAFVDLMGIYTDAGASVGTLPMGETVTLKFQIGVPYNVTSAEFNVSLGAKWMTRKEILSMASINGGTSASYDLSSYAESIQTITVPVRVVNDPKNNEEHIRIAWTYKYTDNNGTHTITGYIYPAITEQALRCGDGWAVNFRVDGPKPAPTKLFQGTDYKVHVEYARCDANAPSVTAVLYVDKNKVTTGAIAATRRYDFGTVDLPVKFSAEQKGDRKLDVRLIAGSDENVTARKFRYYTVLGQGQAICMKITTTPNIPYVGQTVTVTATPTDCNGNTVPVNINEINMIITGGHAVDNPPLYMDRTGDHFVYTFTPKRYGDVMFACKSSVYSCQAVKPSTVWIFAKNGIEITGQKIFWVPKANHNGVKRINMGTYHVFNYTIYPVRIDEVNVTCDDPAAEATATLPGTIQPGTYSDFLVKVSYAGSASSFPCTIFARGYYQAPNGVRRYMTAKYTFTVATGDLALAVDAPTDIYVIPGVSTEFNVIVGTNNNNKTDVKNVSLVAHTLDDGIQVSIHPNRVELPPGETRSFTVIVSAKGESRTTHIKFDASGKVGLYTVHSNDAETTVHVENPSVVEANIISPKNGEPGVEVNGTSAMLDLGFYTAGKISLRIRNLTSHQIYIYPENIVAKGDHAILSMLGSRESPAVVKPHGTYTVSYSITTTSAAPFDPETIRLAFKIAAKSADGRMVYPVPDVVFPLTFSRHSPTCLKIALALTGGSASPNKPVAVTVQNSCGFPVDVTIHASGATKIQPGTSIHVGTDGNYYTLTFSAPGTYATYVSGTGIYSDIRSNTITIPVKSVQERKTSASVPKCGGKPNEKPATVQLFSINDAPFSGTGDCRIDYCGYAETEKFLAKQIARMYQAAQSAQQVGSCTGQFCDVTGQVADTEMTIHVKSLPNMVNWSDVADMVAKTAGIQLQVVEGKPNLSQSAASMLYYNGDTIKSPGDYKITFHVYRNRLYPDEVVIYAQIQGEGLGNDYYNGFYAPLFINLGEYTGQGIGQTTVEQGTPTYIYIPTDAENSALKRIIAQEMLAKAFSSTRLVPTYTQTPPSGKGPYMVIDFGDCNGMFLAQVNKNNDVTLTICESYISGISDPSTDTRVNKLAQTFKRFLSMDGSVQGCMQGSAFLVRGYNENLAKTKTAATNDIFVMPGVWSWRTLTFNLGVDGVPRTFKVLSFAVNGADASDVNILVKAKDSQKILAKNATFTVNTDGTVDANVWLNPKKDYR